jgi:hypothetical protein
LPVLPGLSGPDADELLAPTALIEETLPPLNAPSLLGSGPSLARPPASADDFSDPPPLATGDSFPAEAPESIAERPSVIPRLEPERLEPEALNVELDVDRMGAEIDEPAPPNRGTAPPLVNDRAPDAPFPDMLTPSRAIGERPLERSEAPSDNEPFDPDGP